MNTGWLDWGLFLLGACGAASPIIPSEIWAWERNKYLRQDSATLAVQHWNRRAS